MRPRRRMGGVLAVLAMVVATACGNSDDEPVASSATTAPSTQPAVPASAQKAVIVSVDDAATIRVRLDGALDGSPEADVRVALIGVDRPSPDGCFAADSAAFAGQALPVGATVRLAADKEDEGPDGTVLRHVWTADGVLYNADVLRQGVGKAAATGPNDAYRVELFDAEFEAKGAGRGVWGCTTEPTLTTPKVTSPAASSPRVTTPTPSPAPTPTKSVATVPTQRSVPKGQAFSIGVGETVGVTGEDLTVTYNQLVSDSRCPIGVQCIQAGSAEIAVTLAKPGSPPGALTLSTAPGGGTGNYLSYTVDLDGVGRFSPSATLTVG